MSRRNRANSDNSSGSSSGGERRGMGATIKRVLKIKGIILVILIILSIFGVLYLIDAFRNTFLSGSANAHLNTPYIIATHIEDM